VIVHTLKPGVVSTATVEYAGEMSDCASGTASWQHVLGDHAVVGTREQWIAAGVFGPVAPHVMPRIGDVVVAMTGRATVVDSRTQSAASIGLVGMHGSLTAEELMVPLLTIEA